MILTKRYKNKSKDIDKSLKVLRNLRDSDWMNEHDNDPGPLRVYGSGGAPETSTIHPPDFSVASKNTVHKKLPTSQRSTSPVNMTLQELCLRE